HHRRPAAPVARLSAIRRRRLARRSSPLRALRVGDAAAVPTTTGIRRRETPLFDRRKYTAFRRLKSPRALPARSREAGTFRNTSENAVFARKSMDRPILHPFVDELRENDRLRAFVDELPARARVSEAALPLVLAGLHEHLERGLVLLA